MNSSQHSRGRIMFEALCIWALGVSFVGAWLETGVAAHLASAAIAVLYGLSRSVGLFAREPLAAAAEPAAVPMTFAQEPVTAAPAFEEAPPRIEIFAFEPEATIAPETVFEPKLVKAAKPKRRKKAAAAEQVEETVVEQPDASAAEEMAIEPPDVVAFEEPVHHETHIEQLFEPQPFVRQPRAFGRKARGMPPLSTA